MVSPKFAEVAVAVTVFVTLNKYPCPSSGRESSLGRTLDDPIDGFLEKHSEQ